ncbi:MAG: hypothetical protein RLZZ524_1768, partial [Pseudomonadota bacterium]
ILAAVAWWLPGWIKPRLEAEGAAWLGTPVVIEQIQLRPLALELELTGLRIGTAEAPLFKLGGLHVDVAWSSLWRLAPVVSRLTVKQPQLWVTRGKTDEAYNFSPVLTHLRDRLAAQPAQPEKPAGPPPRFELHAVKLDAGQIVFDDERRNQHHRVEQLGLLLPLVSTQPGDLTRPLQPQLSARIDGSEFKLGGDARPFVAGRPAELALDWRGFQLAPWADLIHDLAPPAFAPVGLRGSLDVRLALSFSAAPARPAPAASGNAMAAASAAVASAASTAASTSTQAAADADTGMQLVVRGELGLADFHVDLPTQGAVVDLKSLRLEALDLAPLQGRYSAARLLLEALSASLTQQAAAMAPGGAAVATAVAAASGTASSRAASVAQTSSAHSASASAAPASDPATPGADTPFKLHLAELVCRGCRLAYADPARLPPAHIELTPLELTLADVEADLSRPINVTLDTGLAAAGARAGAGAAPSPAGKAQAPGRIKLAGRLTAVGPNGEASALGRPGSRLALQGRVDLSEIDLRLAQPYLTPLLNLDLQSGRLASGGDLDVLLALAGPGADLPSVGYRGRVDVQGLRSHVGAAGDELLAWRKLGFDALSVAWRPSALQADLGRITLDGLQTRLIIYPDAHLNLQDIVRRDVAAPATSGASAAGSSTATGASAPVHSAAGSSAPGAPGTQVSAPAGAPPVLGWQQLTLSDGAVYFSDRAIKPGVSARLSKLAGSVGAVSSAQPEPARVDLTGAVDDVAPLRIAGRIHPFGARLFTDIEASVRGIPLTRVSSYAERYAGYAIEKGSLSLTLRYKIDQGKLEAENQLFLDQLTFGEEVANPDATKLPVRLAVALLKNSRGEIDLHVPVAGTLDDPQFSIGGVIWRVVVNLVTKAITAPFALLMGSDDTEMGAVAFAPGSAELDAAARERLDSLIDKLLDRPTLKLDATGQADPVRDGAELQRRAAQAKAASAASAVGSAASSASRAAGAAASAPMPPAAPASAASAPALDAAALDLALRVLADQRAERVLQHLVARLPIERIALTRSRLGGEGDAAQSVQFTLR